jgi:DNA mismatch repair protein MutS
MSKEEKLTPIRKQYLSIKKQYPDAILFFRLGDFYETFDRDAEIAARELDIVLTSRNVAKGNRIPMAGIPHHAAENYLARLIERGYHVAICEQMGNQPIKGLVPRKVVRVITPGTVVESGMLTPSANNYLACVVLDDSRAGVGFVDITTGEFAATELEGADINQAVRSELMRLNPAELLISDAMGSENNLPGYHTRWPAWRFELGRCQDALQRHFEVASLEGFGLRGMPLAVRAAGSILQYLEETQRKSLKLLVGLSSYQLDEFMVLDAATRRNLELTETLRDGSVRGSLLGVLDHTVTPIGGRRIRQWVSKPLLNVSEIRTRQVGVDHFYKDGLLRREVRKALRPLADLERLINRVVGGAPQPRDAVSIRDTLVKLPELQGMLPIGDSPLAPFLKDLDLCAQELTLLQRSLADEPPATLGHIGIIRPEYSADLDTVLESTRHAREWIAALEGDERKRLGIKSLKVGYNKVFGYYIEVTRSNVDMVPESYIRKQTLVNAERYITPELKEYESLVLNAEERIREIESRLFAEICRLLSASAGRILGTARALANLDVLSALAEAAVQGGYICPDVKAEDVLNIRGGRHPVVEVEMETAGFVPNDVVYAEGERLRIITGPNMSGKSTYLRQTALIVLMAQMGSYVPAEAAEIGLVDRIFTRIGAQDEIHAGQSTFMVEMVEMANILNNATGRSLLILDEVGRGTSTYDGVSIAWAVVEYIHNHPDLRAKTLFATHYHELTQLADLLPGVKNYNVAVSEADGKVVFLHRIVPGSSDRSYGIHVAQLAGVPRPVIQRANDILRQLEASAGDAVNLDAAIPRQMTLFPATNPLLDELSALDINALSPIEALNKLYEWQQRFLEKKNQADE